MIIGLEIADNRLVFLFLSPGVSRHLAAGNEVDLRDIHTMMKHAELALAERCPA